MSDVLDDTIISHPAHVELRAHYTDAEVNDLHARARQRAPDPSIFDDRKPFLWHAEISNTRLDSHFTRMAKSTLTNFAAGLEDGVSFMNSHRTGGFITSAELPLGASLRGKLVNAGGDGVIKTLGDFMTLPGIKLTDVGTDDLIDAMRAGILRDVSVGFYGGEAICDICGRDMLRDYRCPHIPGFHYDPEAEGDDANDRARKTSREKGVLATATWENGNLSEVSGVYDGSTPGAAILKARREAEAGRMTDGQRLLFEQRYRIHLPSKRLVVAVAAPGQEGNMPQSADEARKAGEQTHPDDWIDRALRDVHERVFGKDRAYGGGVAAVAALDVEIKRLRPLADDGTSYREDLITKAIQEGIRAHGNNFAQETYREILRNAPLETIKVMLADWERLAGAANPGGRKTVEGAPPAIDPEMAGKGGERQLPDRAFQG